MEQRILGTYSHPFLCSLPDKAQAEHSPAENSRSGAETLHDSFASIP